MSASRLKPLIDRCRPHSYVAAAMESLRDFLRQENRAGNDEARRLEAHENAVRVYKQALQAIPKDEADALLKAVVVLCFAQLRASERERKLYDIWISEIAAVGTKAPLLAGSIISKTG